MKEIFNAKEVKPVLDKAKRRIFDPTLCYSPYWEDPWYLEFRRLIKEKQVKDNTSSVYWETVSILGETIRFPTYFNELAFMPQDLEILRRWKMKTVNKFLATIKRLNMTFMFPGADGLPDDFLAIVNLADHAVVRVHGPDPARIATWENGKFSGFERLHNTVVSGLTLHLYSLPPLPIEEVEKIEDHGASLGCDYTAIRQDNMAYLPEFVAP